LYHNSHKTIITLITIISTITTITIVTITTIIITVLATVTIITTITIITIINIITILTIITKVTMNPIALPKKPDFKTSPYSNLETGLNQSCFYKRCDPGQKREFDLYILRKRVTSAIAGFFNLKRFIYLKTPIHETGLMQFSYSCRLMKYNIEIIKLFLCWSCCLECKTV
jgi:hypothetical protein